MLCIFNWTTVHTQPEVVGQPTVWRCAAENAASVSEPMDKNCSISRQCVRNAHRCPPSGGNYGSASHPIAFWRFPVRMQQSAYSTCTVHYCRCNSRMRNVHWNEIASTTTATIITQSPQYWLRHLLTNRIPWIYRWHCAYHRANHQWVCFQTLLCS